MDVYIIEQVETIGWIPGNPVSLSAGLLPSTELTRWRGYSPLYLYEKL
jgi:hypothetical protein